MNWYCIVVESKERVDIEGSTLELLKVEAFYFMG